MSIFAATSAFVFGNKLVSLFFKILSLDLYLGLQNIIKYDNLLPNQHHGCVVLEQTFTPNKYKMAVPVNQLLLALIMNNKKCQFVHFMS